MTGTILTIDIGTSSVKAALWDAHQRPIRTARQALPNGAHRLAAWSVGYWLEALHEAIPPLCAGYSLEAIVLSGNGPTVVAVDESGAPLDPVLLWLDERRSTAESASFYLPKIDWLADHARTLGRTVRWFLPFPEYLIYWMTGEAVAITPSEAFTRHMWDHASPLGPQIERAQLPPYVSVGTVVGALRAEAAALLGLKPGVAVIAGGPDFLMSLLGTATVRPGRTCDRAGTSEGINFCAASPVRAPQLRVLPHVIEGYFNVAGILSATGLLFEWFRDISGQHGRDYGEMIGEILTVEVGRDGPWFFPSAQRGGSWEFRSGMFIGLGAQHTRAVMGRAVVLSIGFAVREALHILNRAGCPVESLRSCGGQAKNALWNQMKADIVGVPVLIPEMVDAELAGNLAAALVGLGRCATLMEAAEAVVRFRDPVEPRPALHAVYTESYQNYMANYDRFLEAFALATT